jgi:hypothetical protein
MARPILCTLCKEVLELSSKDYVVCGNCGEFNWVGSENSIKAEPDIRERLAIAKRKMVEVVREKSKNKRKK